MLFKKITLENSIYDSGGKEMTIISIVVDEKGLIEEIRGFDKLKVMGNKAYLRALQCIRNKAEKEIQKFIYRMRDEE